jgi:proteic killer suppression protein
VIKSFGDRRTADLAAGKRVREFQAFEKQAQRRLLVLDAAERIEDLRMLPSNRLEALRGDRQGQFSSRINEQWRICFTFSEGNAFDVEITDDH